MKKHCITIAAAISLVLLLVNSAALAGQGNVVGEKNQDTKVKGVVFWDRNKNNIKDRNEPGIPNVAVSNGIDVVKTGRLGRYLLPAFDEMTVFISKPSEFMTPLDVNNVPQFYYIHQPGGSPEEIQEFEGLAPTGLLPESVDFPLYKTRNKRKFKAIIIGDSQPYNNEEISYIRDTIVKEVHDTNAAFAIAMGDNIGDVLSLYPRYLSVMSGIGMPIYYVAGNHDLNYDSPDDEHSFDTFKRYCGPTYYSFNYGKVHFVILDDVVYPSPIFSHGDDKTYHGEINEKQMEWLANDLAFVPEDYLIVLNMHIPIVSFVDSTSDKHQVRNRGELYALMEGRNVLGLAGHTHTLSHFQPGDELEGWGEPLPFPEIIVGAACGSWWSGDMDENGIPLSYQRGGAPRGYMVFQFKKNQYVDEFKATGKSRDRDINISFWTDSFANWYNSLNEWMEMDPENRPDPVNRNDLPNQGIITLDSLHSAVIVANVWNARSDSTVICQIDDNEPVEAVRSEEIGDPFALWNQLNVLHYSLGFNLWNDVQFGPDVPQPLPKWMWTERSPHIWTCELPEDLAPGIHQVKVRTTDEIGRISEEVKAFEVVTEFPQD